jgi:hypothetical protein
VTESAEVEVDDSSRPIKVFVSDAHDNDRHMRLAESVAEGLASRGMTVLLDNWRNSLRELVDLLIDPAPVSHRHETSPRRGTGSSHA